MGQKRLVIIGGGLGGLAAGLRLAARGWRVTVCEQGGSFGGKMNSWSERGFRFDTGPSLITMPWVFASLFEAAGSSLAEHLTLVPLDPIAEYVYPDRTRLTYTASLPDWLGEVRRLDRRDTAGFLGFLELGARLFAVSERPSCGGGLAIGRGRATCACSSNCRCATAGGTTTGRWPRTSGARTSGSSSTATRHTSARRRIARRRPSPSSRTSNTSSAAGTRKAGSTGSSRACSSWRRRPASTLLPRSRVPRIEHTGGRVRGVRLADGTSLPAEVVVMNGDASDAPGLLGEAGATRLRAAERSMSGLVFLFGVRRTLPELRHHTIYFSGDYRREFAELFDERRFPEDPTVYVNAPSRSDRSVVPGEGEALFVMANAPAGDDDAWDEEQIARCRGRVMARLRAGGFPDIESDIVVTDVWTPRRIACRYSMPGGAIYGTHSHGWRRAFLRPPNKDRSTAAFTTSAEAPTPAAGRRRCCSRRRSPRN